MLIVLFDAENEEMYYVEMAEYFAKNRLELQAIEKTKRIFIPKGHIFTPAIVTKYQQIKNGFYSHDHP